jgi:hypothetical protein
MTPEQIETANDKLKSLVEYCRDNNIEIVAVLATATVNEDGYAKAYTAIYGQAKLLAEAIVATNNEGVKEVAKVAAIMMLMQNTNTNAENDQP